MRVFNLFKGEVFHQYYPRVIIIFRIFGYSGNDFLKFGNAGYYHFLLTTFGKNFSFGLVSECFSACVSWKTRSGACIIYSMRAHKTVSFTILVRV